MKFLSWLSAGLSVVILAGCASGRGHAPVTDRGAAEKKSAAPVSAVVSAPSSPAKVVPKALSPEKDDRPQTYIVQKGDTLYSIAFNQGLGYREIIELNNISNPDMIRVGQEIRLLPAGTDIAARPVVETRPLAESRPAVETRPLVDSMIKNQPRVAKLPYSEQALADIEKMQSTPHITQPAAAPGAEQKPEPKPDATAGNASDDDESVLEWGMPTSGKIIGEYSESSNQKGVEIAGTRGQAVVASAAGKVVYSGSGLRGYGKLVIIKHNKTFLSAYAHNDQILVKEGQSVSKGQKIAEMGSTDADQVKLHFEVRKFGKPVDPSKYLPLIKP